ncbi:MAG TPA: hypothetical protein VHP34_09320 [Alphaproteobacteria bacterium]|nr:hypothetical protein [Alphaproteobacteria bacterium]
MTGGSGDIQGTFIHLIGYPGTGKYTIAQEIKARADFRLVDNHLINNPVFTVARIDGKTALPPQVWENTGRIWRIVLESIRDLSHLHFNFIFTNALFETDPDDRAWYEEIRDFVAARGSTYIPVRLTIEDVEEHRKRLTAEGRDQRFKATDPQGPERFRDRGSILCIDHPHCLTLDVTNIGAVAAAEAVLAHARKCQKSDT